MFELIVAVDSQNGIARNGEIPWRVASDMKYFKEMTEGNVVIMGRRTYETIKKPLKNRINIVLSKQASRAGYSESDLNDKNVIMLQSFEELFKHLIAYYSIYKQKTLFIIGGTTLYNYCIENNLVHTIHHTKIHHDYKCDQFFKFSPNSWLVTKTIILQEHSSQRQSPPKSSTSIILDKLNTLMETEAKTTRDTEHKEHKEHKVTDMVDSDSDTRVMEITSMSPLAGRKLAKDDVTALVEVYQKMNYEEEAVLKTIQNILVNNKKVIDRTKVGTIRAINQFFRFNLQNNSFPLFTARQTYFKSMFTELMFIIRGQTDTKILEQAGVRVWKTNTSREALDKVGLKHLREGDMGSTYGFPMRHFGAKYEGCDADYKGKGADQLTAVINSLKKDPYGRRHIINLWDVNALPTASLPPCVYCYQFIVEDNKLSCMMTQRSSDVVVAGGWNVGMGALLTYLLAAICGYGTGELCWCVADQHIYLNQIEGAYELAKRTPYMFPKLFIRRVPNSIENFEFSDLCLFSYRYNEDQLKFVVNN